MITYSDFQKTIKNHAGDELVTSGGEARFRLERSSDGVRFTPLSSGKSRGLNAQGVQRYLDIFNETGSTKTSDYMDRMRNASYVLALIKLCVEQQSGSPLVPVKNTSAGVEVRLVPMAADKSDDCSIQEQQENYFLGELSGELCGIYYCRSVVIAEPGTPVLFQYKNHVIAFARFLRAETLPKPIIDGYPKIMVFEPASIRVFAPVTADEMRSIWPGEFKKFNQTKPGLSSKKLDLFFNHVRPSLRLPGFVEKAATETSGGWIGPTEGYVKSGSALVAVSADHNKMQTKLRDELVKEYGAANVKTEQGHVDIRVTTPEEDILFEVKPDESPLSVIRQALGQLLEYAYRHHKPKSGRRLFLVIVGRNPLGEKEKSYMDHLTKSYALPLAYRVVPI